MENEKNFFNTIFGRIILILIFISLAFFAGLTGEIFTKYYLSKIAIFSDLYITDSVWNGDNQIIISDPKKVIIQQDLRANQVKNEVQPSIVSIFKKKDSGSKIINSILLGKDYLGQGMILTSDGWLISTQEVLTTVDNKVVVTNDNQIYEIKKIVKDPLSKTVFIKVEAQNLSVVKLAEYADIYTGGQLLVINNYYNTLDGANIRDKIVDLRDSKYDFVKSSEEINSYFELNQVFSSDFKGSPVFNYQAEVIGIMYSKNNDWDVVIPSIYFNSIIANVLKDELVSRPYLGINYLNLAKTAGLREAVTQGIENGALIIKNEKGVVIQEDSPVFEILKENDIITLIENEKITDNNDLPEILLEYKSNQEISLKYYRDGKEYETSFILK